MCKDEVNCRGIQSKAGTAINELGKHFEIWIFSGMPSGSIDEDKRKRELASFLDENGIHYDRIILNKPLACFLIDDRAIHHVSWTKTLAEVKRRVGEWPPT